MSNAYMVRCTAAQAESMAGIYAAGLTQNGMIATWKPGRARRFDSESAARNVATSLERKFCGTVWTAVPVSAE